MHCVKIPAIKVLSSFIVGLLSVVGQLRAEVFELTDKQGRSIKADVMSLSDGVLKIRREDGMYFDLALNLLGETDQKRITKWAADEEAREAALPLPAHAFEVSVSRTKFEARKTQQQVQVPIATVRGIEYETKIQVNMSEDWGYGVTIANRLSKPVSGLRVEYRVYLNEGGGPRQALSGSLPLTSLKTRETQALKTKGITMNYSYLQGNPAKSPGGQIHGIWVRIYRGENLEKEYATPDNLLSDQRW